MPWHLPVNRAPPIAPLTDQGVESINEGRMRILEEINIEFLTPEASGSF
jgi:trimethylamine:corrinoid methyltransferase-like protein